MAQKKFSRTQKMIKANLARVPADKPGVYRIKDSSGKVLYIGKAKGTRLNGA